MHSTWSPGRAAATTRCTSSSMLSHTTAARPGDHVLCMSNGGFGGVHGKLLDALARTRP